MKHACCQPGIRFLDGPTTATIPAARCQPVRGPMPNRDRLHDVPRGSVRCFAVIEIHRLHRRAERIARGKRLDGGRDAQRMAIRPRATIRLAHHPLSVRSIDAALIGETSGQKARPPRRGRKGKVGPRHVLRAPAGGRQKAQSGQGAQTPTPSQANAPGGGLPARARITASGEMRRLADRPRAKLTLAR